MLSKFNETTSTFSSSELTQSLDMDICQADYPIDRYQEEFIPYAEAYQALPDRKLSTIIQWMTPFVEKAQDHFGDSLLLLAHYYMGGAIVKIIQHFGGYVGDSYQLSLQCVQQLEKKIIVESAVHFMAESVSILSNPDQSVYITNPKSGCTMEMLAKDYMVEPALFQLNERYGSDTILPISYMNTSGRVKALTGAQGGAVCTSSNVKKIFQWALAKNKKILFIPDKNMGENVADWLSIPDEDIAYWPAGPTALQFNLAQENNATQERFDRARIILFASYCGVHSYYQSDMVRYWQTRDYHVIVHPECERDVVRQANETGSTAFIWEFVTHDKAKTQRYAIGTENHLVDNLREHCQALNIDVVNIGQAKINETISMGCGCATMSRNDPPHLVALLDLLRQGKAPDFNRIAAGDIVNEFTGQRQRLDKDGQQWVVDNARKSLERMISISES